MKSKILVIPSWYPTVNAPVTGSFCQEQTDLVFENYDNRVLYPIQTLVSKINTGKKLFRLPLTEFEPVLLGKTPGVKMTVYVSTFHSAAAHLRLLFKEARIWLNRQQSDGWKPSAIHAHGTEVSGELAAELARWLKIPYVVTEHHSLLVSQFNPAGWSQYRKVLEGASLVLAVSHELKKMILMNGIRAKIDVIGNMINEDLFVPRAGARADGPLRVLFVAVPAHTKDIPTFVSSLGLLKRRGKMFEARLVIPSITADLNRDEIVALCRGEKILNECRVDGTIPHHLMPGIMNDTDVLVSTSITETFGLSIAEAIMSGLPVISTRSGGPEDFVNESNGVLVDIGDIARIADALEQVPVRFSTANQARNRNEMVLRFGKESFKKRLISAYHTILND